MENAQESRQRVALGAQPGPEEQRAAHDEAMDAASRGIDPTKPQSYQVPVTSVALPSGGKVYPVESPLNSRASIDVRAMTARDEDVLTSRSLLRSGRAMSTLLKGCIIEKSVDPDEMLVGDRNAVLIALRASSYGSSYACKVQCPECEESFEHDFELDKLEVKPLEEDPVEAGRNLFGFTLPMSKRAVTFKLLTGGEEREISNIMEKQKKARGVGSVENSVTLRLLHQLVSVDGVADRSKIGMMVRNMLAGDSFALRKHIEDVSPRVKMEKEVECPNCGEFSEVDMPVGADFFWPSTR